MEIRIEPLDTLFFRDGKPFTMGEDTHAESHSLPSPSVLYGALRTAFATQNNIELDDIETQLNGNNFKIKNIYYYTDQNRLPMPLDLVEFKSRSDKKERDKVFIVNALKLVKRKSIISIKKAIHITYFLQPDEQAESIDDGLISTADLEEYLIGYLEEVKVKRFSKNYMVSEAKIGIGREDATKTTEDGKLFRTDMKRYQKGLDDKPLQIAVLIDTSFYWNPLVRLGGEGKMVCLNQTPSNSLFQLNTQDIDFEGGRFKVYLSTPAIFEDGMPNLLKKIGIQAQLITACIGKPTSIGGFDLKKGAPKKMYKVVPAGSVYYFKSEEDLSLLHEKQGISISDVYDEQGFGIAYFGNYHLDA
jgi:CRISPR-associated protein Cmr3